MWFILFLAIGSLTIQAELVDHLQSTYDKPTLIVYCVHASFIFVLFGEYYRYLKRNGIAMKYYGIMSWANVSSYFLTSTQLIGKPFPHVLFMSFLLVSLYNVSTWFWYLAIDFTSTNELTAIFNTGTCFAYIFSIIFVNEPMVLRKWFGVLLCMLGICLIALVGYSGGESADSHLYGNFLGLVGAILYGLYDTLYFKYAVPAVPNAQFSYFFTGLMGISSLFTFWVPVAINNISGKEPLVVPTDYELFILVLVIGFGVLFDTLFFQLISMTSPTIAAAGILLSIPSVLICDLVLLKTVLTWNMVFGSAVLCLGFYILHMEEFHVTTEYQELELEPVPIYPLRHAS